MCNLTKDIKKRGKDFIVPMSSDVVTKGIMKGDNEFFIKLISKILNIPEEYIKGGVFIDNEVVNETSDESHKRVDLLYSKKDYLLVNFEANTYTLGILYRNTIYTYKIIIDERYIRKNGNRPFYQINMDTKYFDCNKKLINRFEMRELETGEILPYTPIIVHVSLEFLEEEEYTKGVDEWLLNALRLYKTKSKKEARKFAGNDEVLKKAEEFMEKYSMDKKVLGEYDAEEDAQMIKEFDLEDATNKGIAEGRTEGRKSGIKETAKNMLKDKLNIESIMKYTGLSKKEIEALK